MSDAVSRPIQPLSISGSPAAAPPRARHETVLTAESTDAAAALAAALAIQDPINRRLALQRVVSDHPAFLEGWARLSDLALGVGESVEAYAYARVAYHRGLDRLRREGWGGSGLVRWSQPTNRGFLRGLRALLAAAAALDETDEAVRCRAFLLDLDPDDGLDAGAYPEVPGMGWVPPPLP